MLVANPLLPMPASRVLATYLGLFLNVWSTVIIVLSAGSVSLEADIVADSILSRACTRTQYILAKLTARALVIEGLFLLGSGAAGYACWRYGANDMTWGSLLTGLAIVGMALLMLVSLGVTMSVLFNSPIVSIIGLLMLWYVAGSIFAFAGVEYMSPASLTRSLPEILRDSNAPQVVSCSATQSSVSVLFSKKVKPDQAQQIQNYTVESPPGTRYVPRAAAYDSATATVVLSGFHFQPGKTVTVTVEGVTDGAGNALSPAANRATSDPIPATVEGEEGKSTPSESSQAPSERGTVAAEKQESPASEPSRPSSEEETVLTEKEPPPAAGEPEQAPPKPEPAFQLSPTGPQKPPRVIQVKATPSSVSVAFSQKMDPVEAEKLSNYTVESPWGTLHTPKTAVYNASSQTVLLSGLSFQAGQPVKVTVKNVTNLQGLKISPRHNSGMYREAQTWKYFAGFGLPTLFSAALGVLWFSRRDL